ncbi:hypothetical protein FJ364_03095 [Candidatus Dependentiae bacterium]|nr:hypothetical protein [Candidatus Dependentiae bacterium]
MIHYKILLKRWVLFLLVMSFTCNMGDKNKSTSTNDPGFARLAEGEGSFRAIVYDENHEYTLKDVSFFGNTSVGGVRRESDDSLTRLELSKIKELKIIQPHFDSKRFGDKDFVLAEITSRTGAVIADLLVPKKLVICGLDEKSGLEKSWFLHKINRLVMQGATPLVLPSIPVALSNSKEVIAKSSVASTVKQIPTSGSQEKTKRTYRPAKQDKWEAFYKNNQMPVGDSQQVVGQEKRSIGGAFVALIDAIIDFFKAIINNLFKLF